MSKTWSERALELSERLRNQIQCIDSAVSKTRDGNKDRAIVSRLLNENLLARIQRLNHWAFARYADQIGGGNKRRQWNKQHPDFAVWKRS